MNTYNMYKVSQHFFRSVTNKGQLKYQLEYQSHVKRRAQHILMLKRQSIYESICKIYHQPSINISLAQSSSIETLYTLIISNS
jgi:hypothetical protein